MPPQRVCQDAPSVFLSGTDCTEYCGYAFGELMEIHIIPTLYICNSKPPFFDTPLPGVGTRFCLLVSRFEFFQEACIVFRE